MRLYSNRFQFAFNNECNELSISFSQCSPEFELNDEESSEFSVKIEPIADLILPYSLAKDLSVKLNEIVKEIEK